MKLTNSNTKLAKASAIRKVFFIKESLLQNAANGLTLERCYHPGKGEPAYFLTHNNNKQILEVLEFAEQHRSWLIDNDVCSNGRLYITTPIDVSFFALHYIKQFCTQKALSLHSICAELAASDARLLLNFVDVKQLEAITDVRRIDDCAYYKYNAQRAMAWLAIKAQRLANALLACKVHCGLYAQSANYNPVADEAEQVDVQSNALRMACGIVGSYVDASLQKELLKYFNLDDALKVETENDKRKSNSQLSANDNKKAKIETVCLDATMNKLATPAKERVLSSKEKQLAKSAKGTKSISSFFKK